MQLRVQKNSTFFGLYTYTEIFEGTGATARATRASSSTRAGTRLRREQELVEYRFEKKNPEDEDFTTLAAFLNGVDLTGTAQTNNLLATANIPEMINFAVATAIVEHTDSSSKNFYLSQDPVTGRWSVIPWDLDHTFGHKCCGVTQQLRHPGRAAGPDQRADARDPGGARVEEMYFRRLRTVVNSVLATGRLEAVYNAKVTPAAPESALDFAKWTRPADRLTSPPSGRCCSRRSRPGGTCSPRTAGCRATRARRPTSSSTRSSRRWSTARVASTSSSTTRPPPRPWTSPAGRCPARSICRLQPGTVIVPGGRMTFVANDPRSRIYGGTVFVGGVLHAAASARPARSPVPCRRLDRRHGRLRRRGLAGRLTGHPIVELVNPTSDNSLGTSWAASTGSAGSPGAANQTAVVGSLPGRPDHRCAGGGRGLRDGRVDGSVANGGYADHGLHSARAGHERTQVGSFRRLAERDQPVVTGLTAGDAYTFQVAAINACRRRCALGGVRSGHAGADPRVVASDHHRGDRARPAARSPRRCAGPRRRPTAAGPSRATRSTPC